MSGFEFNPLKEPAANQPEDNLHLQQGSFSDNGGGGGVWRAGYGSVAPLALQATEGQNTQPQEQTSSSAPWRAGYNQVAPLAQQATEGQVTQPQPASGAAPWRANYNQVAPLAQQATEGQATQPQTSGTPMWRPGYNQVAPIVEPVTTTPPYSTGNPQTPIVYEPGTGGNPLPAQPIHYDTGTHGVPPSNVPETGYPITPVNQGPQFNPGQNGGAAHENPRGGDPGNKGHYADPSPQTGDYRAPKDPVAMLPAAILGGAGGYLGGHLIPKYTNPLADKLATADSGLTLRSVLDNSTVKKIVPDSLWNKASTQVNEWDAKSGQVNYSRDLATGWQNNFNPQYATRQGFQTALDTNTTALNDLQGKSGLSAEDTTTLGELQYARNQHDAAKAAGEKVGRFKGAAKLNKLKGETSLSTDEVNKLADLQAKQDLLTDPLKAGKINPDIFQPASGPDLLEDMKKLPFTADQQKLIGDQGKFFTEAEEAAAKNPKDLNYIERPGVGSAALGAALVGGTMFASSALDNLAGGPNALHADNYAIPAAFLYGDMGAKGAMYAGGAIAANFALDKILPASDHSTISDIMRPTGWDALMQGAAFMAPAANNKVRLAALGGAWAMGRMANLDTPAAAGVTGVGVALSSFLLRANPEAAIGAGALELGAFGVSRVMHAFES